MVTHGWKTVAKMVCTLGILTLISGCQTVQFGTQHPFYTMFQHEREPAINSNDRPLDKTASTTSMPPWFESAAFPITTVCDDDLSFTDPETCHEL